MKKIVCIVCSLILFVLASDCTFENNAHGVEIEFPEEFLSQEVAWEKCELF